jgi:hypothetical protein
MEKKELFSKKNENDYILLIMNCKIYNYKADKQKATWLKTLPSYLKYYHVIGESTIEKEYVFDNDNSILYVNTQDDYNSLPKKVIAAYKAINETFEYKYLFKTDDDQILLNDKYFDMVVKLIEKKRVLNLNNNLDSCVHYGGNIVDVPINYLSKYYLIHSELPKELIVRATKYCSGRFYFLSSEATTDLLSKKDKISNEYLEDYAIGYHLSNKYKENMLQINTHMFFEDMK